MCLGGHEKKALFSHSILISLIFNRRRFVWEFIRKRSEFRDVERRTRHSHEERGREKYWVRYEY